MPHVQITVGGDAPSKGGLLHRGQGPASRLQFNAAGQASAFPGGGPVNIETDKRYYFMPAVQGEPGTEVPITIKCGDKTLQDRNFEIPPTGQLDYAIPFMCISGETA